MSSSLPKLVRVKSVVSSRYDALWSQGAVKQGQRPENWDQRISGKDVVETIDNQKVLLNSDGQQSVPQKDWVILLTNGSESEGYAWTLYGMP